MAHPSVPEVPYITKNYLDDVLVLIAAVGYLTWLYSMTVLGSGVSLNLITVVFYVGPPVVGLIATLFLLKPIVIRPPHPPKPLRLLPDNEPLLFEFVNCLCRALGSPRPSHIYVDLRVNASASVRGWRGFFLGHVDLTIGLPLAAGLSLQQFTGVLAHEFGHFAQRTGLRSYFLIQTIRHWFARVVHQRDRMDHWLETQRKHRDWRIKGVAHMAALVVAASRRYLSLLMNAGGWVSSAFSRQMELDADRHEVAIAGATAFEETLRQLSLLDSGAALAWQDASRDWTMGRLPEDVAALVVARTARLPPEALEQILSAESARKTGPSDTHPCLADRIANARTARSYSALALEGPTERIFNNLTAVCREATLHHYRTVLGLEDGAAQLVPVREAIANAQADREYESATQQLFHATPQFCSRWLRLPTAEPRAISESKSLHSAEAEFDADSYDSAVHTNFLHFAALVISRAGRRVNASSFRLPAGDFATIQREEGASGRHLVAMLDQYRQSAAGIATRIESSVAGLLHGNLGLVISAERAASLPDLKAAWSSYGALSQFQDEIMEVRRHHFAVQIIRENARLFPAALCANLIEDLENRALSQIEEAITRTRATPAAVIFDPHLAPTVSAQLAPRGSSNADRIQSFLSRADTMMARSLSELAWFTVVACPAIEDQSPAGTNA